MRNQTEFPWEVRSEESVTEVVCGELRACAGEEGNKWPGPSEEGLGVILKGSREVGCPSAGCLKGKAGRWLGQHLLMWRPVLREGSHRTV